MAKKIFLVYVVHDRVKSETRIFRRRHIHIHWTYRRSRNQIQPPAFAFSWKLDKCAENENQCYLMNLQTNKLPSAIFLWIYKVELVMCDTILFLNDWKLNRSAWRSARCLVTQINVFNEGRPWRQLLHVGISSWGHVRPESVCHWMN